MVVNFFCATDKKGIINQIQQQTAFDWYDWVSSSHFFSLSPTNTVKKNISMEKIIASRSLQRIELHISTESSQNLFETRFEI